MRGGIICCSICPDGPLSAVIGVFSKRISPCVSHIGFLGEGVLEFAEGSEPYMTVDEDIVGSDLVMRHPPVLGTVDDAVELNWIVDISGNSFKVSVESEE